MNFNQIQPPNRRPNWQPARQRIAILIARLRGDPYIFSGPTTTERMPSFFRRWWR